MTVMRSNIKIFKIQNCGRPPCWKYIRNAITRVLGDMMGCDHPSCVPVGRLVGTNLPTGTQLGWSHPIMSPMMRLPWQRPLPTNGALNIRLLWASVAERVNQSS